MTLTAIASTEPASRATPCDATGKRDYVFDLAGHVVSEETAGGTECKDETYAGNRHLVTYDGGPTFDHTDWLGTSRLRNTQTYPTYNFQTCTSLPFGDGLNCNSTYGYALHFTGKERDSESGLDNFVARHYTTSMGRFMSPDPSGIWLADPADPQQLNLYSYARNNPLRFVDPTGLDCVYLNNSGNGVDSIDANSNAQEYTGSDANGNPNGGIWFNGTVDPNSIQTDENSDWVFANGAAGNNQFSCSVGGACDQDSLNSFVNSMAGSNPAMVYGQGTNTGTIQSGLSFDETVKWYKQKGFVEHGLDYLDRYHPGQLDLRDHRPFCSTHLAIDKKSGHGRGQGTTGDFHADTTNPWVLMPSNPLIDILATSTPIISEGDAAFALGHAFADIGHNAPSSAVCH